MSVETVEYAWELGWLYEFQINLKLILVSGKTKEFLFDPTDSVAVIMQYVYDNWPAEWADEMLPSTNILRLIYQGRFLHSNVALSGTSADFCHITNSEVLSSLIGLISHDSWRSWLSSIDHAYIVDWQYIDLYPADV